MKQVIIRITSTKRDAEVLTVENNQQLFKAVSATEILKLLKKKFSNLTSSVNKPRVLSKNIYAVDVGKYAIVQKEQKRYVTYDGKCYDIQFPNSFYIVTFTNERIESIEAYSFKKFKGQDTTLYEYPMPNMLTESKLCIGTADRKIKTNVENTLNSIIETEFTHSSVDGIKGFKDTKKYFQYLSKNPFPYDMLIKTKLKVGDLVDE